MATNTLPMSTTAHQNAARLWQNWIGVITLALVTLISVIAFFAPFLSPTVQQGDVYAGHVSDSPLLTVILIASCLIVVFANLGPALSSKSIALLGVLVGINVLLRVVSNSFLVVGQVTPIFLLVALVGYVFGAQMGFLMGTLTMLCSAFMTAGVGPWLPFQMITTGWIGMTAAWLRLGRPLDIQTDTGRLRREILKLAIFSFIWGFLYGAILNVYFWPFIAGDGITSWTPGISAGDTISRYAAFYIATSIGADLTRAVGCFVLVMALGFPLLRVFLRFQARFAYTVVQKLD
jgi:energy-coupling factor transport system substrate-specific component